MSPTATKTKIVCAAVLGALWTNATAQQRNLTPVTDAMLENPPPADWLSWRRTQNHWGYSPLTQIDKRNVAQLRLVWTRPLAVGVQEGTPLVHDGVMFFPNPNDITQAIDAATGDLIWEYKRPVQEDNSDYIPFPSINRNLAIYGNLILDNGADNFAYALDARTGALVWETQILDYRRGAQHSSGPLVAKGKVISGRSCEPEGGPEACVLTAFDATTGKELWRTRTIPRPDEPGGDSWGNIPYEDRRHVGLWMVPSFDPELNRIYVGTSVTSPAPKFMLAGNDRQYLYHNSTLAIDADTGKIVWYLQHNVDHWDLDHPFERILVDIEVAPDASAVAWINPRVRAGSTHKAITGVPGKTGIVYTIDRETGQFLWARPTVEQNVIARVNTESGQGVVNQEKLFTGPGQEMLVCPSLSGGKNYHAGAYSPQTRLIYVPANENLCASMEGLPVKYSPGGAFTGARTVMSIVPGTNHIGEVQAWNVDTGTRVWTHTFAKSSNWGPLLATGGGLVFGGGTSDRMFRAFDARTGKVLWEYPTNSGVIGQPSSFTLNGRQYVAVQSGWGIDARGMQGRLNRISPGNFPDVPEGGAVWVFEVK
jgi:alcohol dehydrogenase (cytochrome c)